MSAMPAASNDFDEPPEDSLPNENPAMPFFGRANGPGSDASSKAEKARRKFERQFLEMNGVEGVAVETDAIGEDIIVVFVSDESVVQKIPDSVDGIQVRIEVGGLFDAFLSGEEDVDSREPTPDARTKKVKPARKPTGKTGTSKSKKKTKR